MGEVKEVYEIMLRRLLNSPEMEEFKKRIMEKEEKSA